MQSETGQLVEFSDGSKNGKLAKITDYNSVYYFDLPSAHSCPMARSCRSKADRYTGKVTDGKNMVFRCYATSQEAIYKNLRNKRWRNFDTLRKIKDFDEMVAVLDNSFKQLPRSVDCVRLHTSGDFFNSMYFMAWIKVIKRYPEVLFYAYTKSLSYWVKNIDNIPSNMKLTASYGGSEDSLIKDYDLANARVFQTIEDIDNANLPLDTNETNPINGVKEFALLIHGTQPKKA